MKNDSRKIKTEELQKQLDEVTNNWKRALADYQNLEKRTRLEKEEFCQFGNGRLLAELLPAYDTLLKLEQHLKDEGLQLAIKQFHDILEAEGLQKIEVLGRDFNPEEMECVDVKQGEENKVLAEARPGYRFKGKVLRAAQVVVGKKEIETKAEEIINNSN